jgi:RNA-dependent RNA polymerase
MVCLDVANRIINSDVGLYLRPSMKKFDSNNHAIDIVRVSSMPSVGFLNRQIILLLSSLGIRDKIFLFMQEEMLHHLRTLTTDPQKAREFLRKLGGSGGNGYHAFLLEYLKRFGKQTDPFARQILIAFQAFFVKELRTKARILVPNTWSLFGVIDETRTLKYGEVFVQIEQKNDSGDIISKIITGWVIATRNPCFHPGKPYIHYLSVAFLSL